MNKVETIGLSSTGKLLQKYAQKDVITQREARDLIIDAFKHFWKTEKPSMKHFVAATEGLVMFPEIMYIMGTV